MPQVNSGMHEHVLLKVKYTRTIHDFFIQLRSLLPWWLNLHPMSTVRHNCDTVMCLQGNRATKLLFLALHDYWCYIPLWHWRSTSKTIIIWHVVLVKRTFLQQQRAQVSCTLHIQLITHLLSKLSASRCAESTQRSFLDKSHPVVARRWLPCNDDEFGGLNTILHSGQFGINFGRVAHASKHLVRCCRFRFDNSNGH